MLSETLASGLAEYRIGPKIRTLRLKKQLGLTQLGAHTGLSAAMLSKIERGQLFPTLPTLLRIALVFGVGLDHFFLAQDDGVAVTVVRRQERLRLPDRPEEPPCYLFESLDFPVRDRAAEVYYAEFPTDSQPSAAHRHPGRELIYIVNGQLQLTVGEEHVRLARGDAASFDSDIPHSYCREGRTECSAIVVTVPQRTA